MKYALVNGIILDGSKDMQPVKGKAVLVDGDKIVGIVSDLSSIFGYKVIDLKGGYLLPGMINLHVHIPGSGEPKDKPLDVGKVIKLVTANKLTREVLKKMYINYAQTEVYSGVTTIRSVGAR